MDEWDGRSFVCSRATFAVLTTCTHDLYAMMSDDEEDDARQWINPDTDHVQCTVVRMTLHHAHDSALSCYLDLVLDNEHHYTGSHADRTLAYMRTTVGANVARLTGTPPLCTPEDADYDLLDVIFPTFGLVCCELAQHYRRGGEYTRDAYTDNRPSVSICMACNEREAPFTIIEFDAGSPVLSAEYQQRRGRGDAMDEDDDDDDYEDVFGEMDGGMQSLVCEHDVFDWLGMLHGLTRVLTEVRAIQASNRGWQPPPVMT